jgi:transcriptional regulator with XRE-family HTH domain
MNIQKECARIAMPMSVDQFPGNFGSWVRRNRQQRHFDIKQLGIRAGVDPSSISRIERGHTQATLVSAIRLCAVFGVSFDQLVEDLRTLDSDSDKSGASVRPPAPAPAPESWLQSVVTDTDIRAFVHLFRHDPTESSVFLMHSLLTVFDLVRNTWYEEEFNPSRSPAIILHDAVAYVTELAACDAIPHPLHRFTEILLPRYHAGGVIILKDVGTYLRAKRREQGKTLRDLQREVSLSDSSLSRIETATISRVKLAEILLLDSQLGYGGEVARMFWQACTFHMHADKAVATEHLPAEERWTEQEFTIILLLVTISRWMDAIYNYERWLAQLRALTRSPDDEHAA